MSTRRGFFRNLLAGAAAPIVAKAVETRQNVTYVNRPELNPPLPKMAQQRIAARLHLDRDMAFTCLTWVDPDEPEFSGGPVVDAE